MSRLKTLPAIAAGLLLPVVLLYLAVISFAYDPGMYPQEPAPYDEMGTALAGYLSGTEISLPETLFGWQERVHMEDVKELFMAGKRLAMGCGVAALVLLIISVDAWGWTQTTRALRLGFALFFVLCLAIGLWAAIDFNGWFTVMHELVFDNDLWLFDPQTSAMIRMLPLSFFTGAVLRIVARFLLSMLALFLLTFALKSRAPKEKTPCDTPTK